MMSVSTKLKLQRELFDFCDEKLLFLTNVTKFGRKRKNEQLCITITQTLPQQVYIHRVTQSDKELLKCKNTWALNQLRVVDGKERLNTNNTLEFELHFERIFKWSATQSADKNNFLGTLYSIICKFSQKNRIDIRNLDVTRLKKELISVNHLFSGSSRLTLGNEDLNLLTLTEDGHEEYQDLTSKEEQDLKRLFNQTTSAISDAEAFTGQLAIELARLDQLNIETIMRSELQITNLMSVLDTAVSELESMSDHLFECETLLQSARESIEVVQLKDTNLDVEERNSKLLYKDLQLLISQLDLDKNIQDILLHQPLSGECLDICSDKAFQLLDAIVKEFDSGTAMMRSVIDQKQFLNTLKESFVARFYRHMVTEFKEVSQPRDELGLVNFSEYPTLPSHSRVHKKISLYSTLSYWLKVAEPDRLNDLKRDYLSSFGPLYQEEFRNFFHDLKKGALKIQEKSKLPLKRTGSRAIPTGSNLEIPELSGIKSNSIGQLTRSDSISSNISNISAEASVSSSLDESDKFEHIFSVIISQFQHICHREQIFLDNYFHFNSDEKMPILNNCTQAYDEDQRTQSIEIGRNMNQELKICLTKLFDTLQSELESFFHRVNDSGSPFQILYVLQYIYSRVKPKSIDPSSMNYLEICLNNCLPSLQNYFDKYILAFKRHIEDIKNQKRPKDGGILNCVRKYVIFLTNTKAIMFKFDFNNIGHIERYYLFLMESVSKTIDKASFELNKTRSDVCRFENYQFLFSKLSELKIKCLEGCKEEAKKKSREFVEAYTKSMLGRPLERLSFFFEGVDAQLKKGTKPEEIGFISEFHKSELRKCASLYPGKEVRKCLENIYKKVDKHLSPELGMNQVVWHQMQTQLLTQYNNITNLIDRCYSDANIKLDFTLSDLCEYFSDIQK